MDRSGLDALLQRPLIETIWRRRTHRVSQGTSVPAGTVSYESKNPRAPLGELEEAVLIAATGCTGLTMPDRPFQDPSNQRKIMAKPDLWTMSGRTAGSPDNAQGTHFFLINDSGTYFLRSLDPLPEGEDGFTPERLIARAREAKVQLLNQRLDVPGKRDFPAYTDSNRLLSNLPGTTLLFPVVDLSRQYINGMMYLLTEPEGTRPAIRDDRNFYLFAGVKRWVKEGFLNKKVPLPLGLIGSLRTQIEANLLLQNLFLTADAMGLGAWIHGAIAPPVILGDPRFIKQYGPMLAFDFDTPRWRLWDVVRWQILRPSDTNIRNNPIGLRHKGEHLIKGATVHAGYYATMSEAVDAVIAGKFGPDGIYKNAALFDRIYKPTYGQKYLDEAADYAPKVIQCVKDICTHIYETHGRFPAHCGAIHVPGVWLQAHHVEIEYYDRFFRNGLTEAHRQHHDRWH